MQNTTDAHSCHLTARGPSSMEIERWRRWCAASPSAPSDTRALSPATVLLRSSEPVFRMLRLLCGSSCDSSPSLIGWRSSTTLRAEGERRERCAGIAA